MRGTASLMGRTFGYLQVTGQAQSYNGSARWKCRCKCGRELTVYGSNLLSGRTKSCGCLSREKAKARFRDLTGQSFGRLTVLQKSETYRHGRVSWECRCACGGHCTVAGHELLSGKTQSCGCLRVQNGSDSAADLRGRQFGRLTALRPTDKRDAKGSVIWLCRCRCGGSAEASQDALTSGGTVSCGCRKREVSQQLPRQLHLVADTGVEFLERRKSRSDNKSGFRGVTRLKNGRYRAAIGMQKKRYLLGTYSCFEDAVRARLQAEQQLHDTFVAAWRDWSRYAQTDPAWARENPFAFQTEQVERTRFHVRYTMAPR